MLSNFSKNIAVFVDREIVLAEKARASGEANLEFQHLENAHVIGQESTYWHVKVHILIQNTVHLSLCERTSPQQ